MTAYRGTLIQFGKFATVGALSNAALFLLYLVLTLLGLGHKVAMTLCFAIGVLQTFLFNKNWTFAYRAGGSRSLLRYIAAYFSAYLINLLALLWLVDGLQLPHQLVQGFAIVLLALYLFVLQKFWVFPRNPPSSADLSETSPP